MIKLTDSLVITADEHQYIMGRPVTRKGKDCKTKTEIKNPHYYTDLAAAVRGAVSQFMRAGVAGDEITSLRGFLDEYQRQAETFNAQVAPLKQA